MSAIIRTAINIQATGELGWTSPFAQIVSSMQEVVTVSEFVLADGQTNVAMIFSNMTIINTLFLYTAQAGFTARLTTLGNSPFEILLPGAIYGFANCRHVFADMGTAYLSYAASPTPGLPGKLYAAVAGT